MEYDKMRTCRTNVLIRCDGCFTDFGGKENECKYK